MGIVRDVLSKGVEFIGQEISPIKYDLIKAGILAPDKSAYEQKASLVDPLSYQAQALGYKEKFSLLDYSRCRQITYTDPVVAAILQVRINQVAASAMPQPDRYKIGFKVRMRDREAKPTAADKKRIKEIEQFIMHCGVPENFEDTPERRRRDGFETFLRKITRDSLTFDQLNFEVTPRNNGLPYSFQAVDASTIRIISDEKETSEAYQGTPNSPNYGYYQRLIPNNDKNPFKEFKPKHPRYAQVVNGVIRHVFDEWEMAFGVRNPRSDILSFGYGFSEIEMLVTTITAHLNAEAYNRKFFSQGSSIKGLLTFEGSVPPEQLEAFRRQWYQQVSGVQNAWKTPIMALGKDSKLNWVSLHSTNREMEFGKWMEYCIKTICGVFQIDPIEIGFDITRIGAGQSGNSGGLGEGNQAERMSYSQDKGLRPLLRHIQALLNDYIVYRLDPNFEFEFVGLNVKSEKDDLDQAVQQVKAFKTVNEIRAEHDLKPIPEMDGIKSVADLPLDPQLIQAWLQSQQAAQPQLGPDGQPMDGDAQGQGDEDEGPSFAPDEEEQEPDYENMSTEELQAELEKLQTSQPSAPAQKPGAQKAGTQKPPQAMNKSLYVKEIEL